MEQTELDGVRAWGVDPGDEECFAALVFRGGAADEGLPTSGRTHLVEHLAMFGVGPTSHRSNAWVDDRRCCFHATGTPEEVGAFLTAVSTSLHALPLERLEDELRVLRVEEGRHGTTLFERLLHHRFGARGPGLGWFRDFGLDDPEPEELQAFARERFVAENAALWFAGPAPVGVELGLPSGTRLAPLVVEPLARQELPAHLPDGTGGVVVASLPERSMAMVVTLAVAEERARTLLREELGTSYAVASSYDPLDARVAHTLLQADCLDAEGGRCRDRLLGVIERLAAEGFTPEEHATHVEAAETAAREASGVREAVLAVDDHLLEERSPSREEVVERVRALDADAIRDAARELAESAIVIVPDGTPMPKAGRLKRWGAWNTEPVVGGEEFLRARARLRRPAGRLLLAEDGLTLEDDEGVFTILFAELAIALREPEGVLELTSHEEVEIRVGPDAWEDGPRLMEALLARIPAELVRDSPLLVRTRRVEAAVEEMRTARLVGQEVRTLAGVLDDTEEVAWVERAQRKLKFGLLAATSRRLLFLYEEDVRQWSFGEVGAVSGHLGKLTAVLGEDTITIESGRARLAELEERLTALATADEREPGELF